MQVSESFKQFIKKFAPDKFSVLKYYTRNDGKAVKEGDTVDKIIDQKFGYTIIQGPMGYMLYTRAIVKKEDLNSFAIFSPDFKFVMGSYHGSTPDTDGSYHHKLLQEALKYEKIDWDEK